MGKSAGAWLGGKAGSFVDSVTGMGAYNVKRNSLLNSRTIVSAPNGPPRVVNAKRGEATVVNHREYVGDISSGTFVEGTESTGFNIQRWQMNPGNGTLFPWLSAVSTAFQEYEINGMLVELVTEASEVSTNLAMGVMAMAAEYNPLAETPNSKIEMLELEYADVAKVSHSLMMPVECSRAYDGQTHLLTATNNNYLGTDARGFDLGALFVATVGQPAENTKIAEMWLTYEILFYKPRLPDTIGVPGIHAQLASCTSAAPFAGFMVQPGSNPGFVMQAGNTIYFPRAAPNKWFCYFWWCGPTGTTDIYETITMNDMEFVSTMFAGSTGNDQLDRTDTETGTSSNPTKMQMSFIVQVTGPSPYLTPSGGGLINDTFGDFWAFPVPDLIVGAERKEKKALKVYSTKPPKDEPIFTQDQFEILRKMFAGQSAIDALSAGAQRRSRGADPANAGSPSNATTGSGRESGLTEWV